MEIRSKINVFFILSYLVESLFCFVMFWAFLKNGSDGQANVNGYVLTGA